jgi:hypothetical protein
VARRFVGETGLYIGRSLGREKHVILYGYAYAGTNDEREGLDLLRLMSHGYYEKQCYIRIRAGYDGVR